MKGDNKTMKTKTLYFWASMVTMAGISACAYDTGETISYGNEIKLTADIASSRVTDLDYQSTQIVPGQQVGITITGADARHYNVPWQVGADGYLTNGGDAVHYVENKEVAITAYHPYDATWTGKEHSFSVKTDQSTKVGYLASDLLWTTERTSDKNLPVSLSFNHKLAKVNVTLTSTEVADLSGATISICGTRINTGFNPITGDLYDAPIPDVQEIKASVTTADAYTASAIVVPQTVAGGTSFIKVVQGGNTYHYTLPADKKLESGHSYHFTISLKGKAVQEGGMIPLGENLSMHPKGIALQYTGIEDFKDFFDVKYDEDLGKEIYSKFEDAFDFIFFLYNTTSDEFAYGGFAYAINRNISGLDKENADIAYRFGNPKKLKGISHLTSVNSIFSGGPFLHELAHYWGAAYIGQEYVTTTMSYETASHWGTSDINGVLGGFDYKTLKRNVDGNPKKYHATSSRAQAWGFAGFSQELSSGYYAPIELYLMGLLPADEVPDMHVFKGVSVENDTFGDGTFYAESEVTYTIEDFIARFGERIPDYQSSQKDFQALVVVVTDEPVSDEEWALIESDILKQEKQGPVNDEMQTNFWEATGGRATITLSGIDKFLKK